MGKVGQQKGFYLGNWFTQKSLKNRIEARKREKYLKSGIGRAYLDKILRE